MREEKILVGSRKEIEDFIFSKSYIREDYDKIINPNFNIVTQLDNAERNFGYGLVFYTEIIKTEDEEYLNVNHVYVHIVSDNEDII
jgi:hypothetical protein